MPANNCVPSAGPSRMQRHMHDMAGSYASSHSIPGWAPTGVEGVTHSHLQSRALGGRAAERGTRSSGQALGSTPLPAHKPCTALPSRTPYVMLTRSQTLSAADLCRGIRAQQRCRRRGGVRLQRQWQSGSPSAAAVGHLGGWGSQLACNYKPRPTSLPGCAAAAPSRETRRATWPPQLLSCALPWSLLLLRCATIPILLLHGLKAAIGPMQEDAAMQCADQRENRPTYLFASIRQLE